MKRCPTCDRTFDDEALGFCPNDGSRLEQDAAASPPQELQATMMATPSSLGGVGFPPPPASGPSSGSFNPPPSNASWENQQAPPNPSWAKPAAGHASAAPTSGALNKKLIFGGIGCLALGAVALVIGIVLVIAFSGPSSKMSPYKGDLKALVPENVDTYKRVDVHILKDGDKRYFGKVNDAIGVAYEGTSDTEIRMFVGNYANAKDAEDGLKSFKDEMVSDGFVASELGSKKLGWSKVGIRYVLTKIVKIGQNGGETLPEGATLVRAQASSSTNSNQSQFIGWTNGSVVYVVRAEGTAAIDFEKVFDKEVK